MKAHLVYGYLYQVEFTRREVVVPRCLHSPSQMWAYCLECGMPTVTTTAMGYAWGGPFYRGMSEAVLSSPTGEDGGRWFLGDSDGGWLGHFAAVYGVEVGSFLVELEGYDDVEISIDNDETVIDPVRVQTALSDPPAPPREGGRLGFWLGFLPE